MGHAHPAADWTSHIVTGRCQAGYAVCNQSRSAGHWTPVSAYAAAEVTAAKLAAKWCLRALPEHGCCFCSGVAQAEVPATAVVPCPCLQDIERSISAYAEQSDMRQRILI